MATRFDLSGPLSLVDIEIYRRKLPLTPEARIDGRFVVEEGRKYSPKGLLPGKYNFWTEPERNVWPDGTVFWRSGAVAIFPNGENSIVDYDMYNISTFFAYESIEMQSEGRHVPICHLEEEIVESHARKIVNDKIFLEVLERFPSNRWRDYWPVRFRIISKTEFMNSFQNDNTTSTFKEFERRLGDGLPLC